MGVTLWREQGKVRALVWGATRIELHGWGSVRACEGLPVISLVYTRGQPLLLSSRDPSNGHKTHMGYMDFWLTFCVQSREKPYRWVRYRCLTARRPVWNLISPGVIESVPFACHWTPTVGCIMAAHSGSRVIRHSIQVVNSMVWGGKIKFQAPESLLSPPASIPSFKTHSLAASPPPLGLPPVS